MENFMRIQNTMIGNKKIGKTSYELYECTKTTYLKLNKGGKILASRFSENLNNKTYHYIQLNINTKIKVPQGKYPETSFVKLSDSDMTAYTKYDLKIMRNEIFPRNGYIFKKGSEMDTYFKKQEWFNSIHKTNNPNLNAFEKHNVSLISKFEQKFRIDKMNLGEDIAEINCYVKKIYRKNNLTFVDIDIVQIKYYSEGGERHIINENPKIRTYIVDDSTIIYGHNCERITPEKLTEIEKSIIVVGSAKDGVLESINFGCYG